jgi:nucleoside-diphosphate-sugar epimerase
VARCLIVGCGCRGRQLAAALLERGHIVRGTTRNPAALAAIQEVGAQPTLADPDRLATLIPALDHVTLLLLLLGSATGTPDALRSLHTDRLEALLVRVLDTTVRGVVYECAGSVPEPLLKAGGESVARHCGASRIPFALARLQPGQSWAAVMLDAVDRVLPAGGATASRPGESARMST